MSEGAFGIAPFSADVALWLEGDFGRIPLAQTAADFVRPVTPQNLPEGEACIVTRVDGREHKRPVVVIGGLDPTQLKVPVRPVDQLPF